MESMVLDIPHDYHQWISGGLAYACSKNFPVPMQFFVEAVEKKNIHCATDEYLAGCGILHSTYMHKHILLCYSSDVTNYR